MPEITQQITQKDLYTAIESTRKELTDHILRLESKFDILEAGRLSATEKKLAEVTAELDPLKRIIYGMVGTILIAVLSALLYLVLK